MPPFPSMFVSSLCEFPENCVYKHCGLNCFIENLYRVLLTAIFLPYDIESAKKVHLLNLRIKAIISYCITTFVYSNQK